MLNLKLNLIMKKLIIIITMVMAGSIAFAQENTDKTLYLIDGVVSQKTAVDALPKDLINNMEVIKGVESVVVITTKSKAAAETPVIVGVRSVKIDELGNDIEHQSTATITYRSTSPTDGVKPVEPLCIVKSPDGTLVKGNMQSISPDTIKSIHVLKDGNKTEPYKNFGDTSHGVILVELK